MGMGYAVAYPFGICGILLTMWLVRVIFRINVDREAKNFEQQSGQQSGICRRLTWQSAIPIWMV